MSIDNRIRGLSRSLAFATSLVALSLLLWACAGARTQIRIVGSSTVFPFTTAVAENFHRTNPEFLPPIVEATGTGGGMKLFCGGVGSRYADVVNASRRMKPAELDECARNGATEVVEIRIGIDGVVLVQGKAGEPLNLSLRDIYAGLAAEPFGQPQTARTWKDVNPALPDVRIEVIGQPSTSGTREAFNELYMEAGCNSDPAMQALKKEDESRYKSVCMRTREDGGFAEAGENDNLIVQRLSNNPSAIGVLGFNFMEANLDTLRPVEINGVHPSYEAISEGAYPASRPLFIYVKKQHVRAIRGLQEFVDEYASERAWGPQGYLRRRGLIPLNAEARAIEHARAAQLIPLTREDLAE